MKITSENFDEQFDAVLARLAANVDLEVTDAQKQAARHNRHSVEINRAYYRHEVKENPGEIYICNCCGALATATYSEPIKTQMLADKTCFHCNYWKDLAAKVDPKRLVVSGHIYGDGGNSPNSRPDWLGFSGHVWYIERDGKRWETNNLWSGSTVPQAYIASFPDNAKFLSKEEFFGASA